MTQDNGGQVSIRKDNWKYMAPTKERPAELYDLSVDPSELHDVIYAYSQIANQLQDYIRERL